MNILFVTDVHGSEKCFRKFLNSWKYYPIHCLIMGGDLSGKGLVPIINDRNDNFHASFLGEDYIAESKNELELLEKNIRFNGFYPFITDTDGVESLEQDEILRNEIFEQLIVEQIDRWDQLAGDYLKDSGIPLYIIPGNDDIYAIDKTLNKSSILINIDNKIQEIEDGWYIIGAGYSNHTPWHGPREFDDEEIFNRIETLVKQVPNNAKTIFDFHCPPYDSVIDLVQEVDEDFRPRFQGINPVMGPAGCKAVRKIYDLYTPNLGLHGHIHESKGVYKYKGAIAINPGSDYSSGIMKGVIVTLGKSKVEHYMFIEG